MRTLSMKNLSEGVFLPFSNNIPYISQISFAVLGVTTNLVSIYVLSRKELINTFNQVNTKTGVKRD